MLLVGIKYLIKLNYLSRTTTDISEWRRLKWLDKMVMLLNYNSDATGYKID